MFFKAWGHSLYVLYILKHFPVQVSEFFACSHLVVLDAALFLSANCISYLSLLCWLFLLVNLNGLTCFHLFRCCFLFLSSSVCWSVVFKLCCRNEFFHILCSQIIHFIMYDVGLQSSRILFGGLYFRSSWLDQFLVCVSISSSLYILTYAFFVLFVL